MATKVLIAVKTCEKYRHRAAAQRTTWAAGVRGADVRFFYGGNSNTATFKRNPDEVFLGCPDDYLSLPAKVRAICRWALQNNYTHAFMCDDDTYVQCDRLLASGFEKHDYIGRLRGPSGGYPAPYCSGFAYWLSATALHAVINGGRTSDNADDRFVGQVLAQAGIKGELDTRYCVTKCDEALIAGNKGDVCEDRITGNVMLKAGITPTPDYRYAVVASKRNALSYPEGPRQGNDIIAACEFEPAQMLAIHEAWLWHGAVMKPGLPAGPLDRVSILLKTFLRDGYLNACVNGIQKQMPEAKIVIVDDGFEQHGKIAWYSRLRNQGHTCLWLPFDSGFGAKGNKAIASFDRDYVLIACDDFNFEGVETRNGIVKLMNTLDTHPEIGVASGRVNKQAYEGFFRQDGTTITETKLIPSGNDFDIVDLTVNYCMVRRSLFDAGLHWCPEWKIGGDHYVWFKMLKDMGVKVAWVSGVNVPTLPDVFQWRLPQYMTLRGRAINALPSMFKQQGIEQYVGFAGNRDMVDFNTNTLRIQNARGLVTKKISFQPEDLITHCSRCKI